MNETILDFDSDPDLDLDKPQPFLMSS